MWHWRLIKRKKEWNHRKGVLWRVFNVTMMEYMIKEINIKEKTFKDVIEKCYLLCVVCYVLCIICYLLSAICCVLCVMYYLLSSVCVCVCVPTLPSSSLPATSVTAAACPCAVPQHTARPAVSWWWGVVGVKWSFWEKAWWERFGMGPFFCWFAFLSVALW